MGDRADLILYPVHRNRRRRGSSRVSWLVVGSRNKGVEGPVEMAAWAFYLFKLI